ncbi:MAG: hypothetical protein IPP86_12500 [Bacteroidetes bacterium]|nr:hypothetical protein [Bacteroidota bacterium]
MKIRTNGFDFSSSRKDEGFSVMMETASQSNVRMLVPRGHIGIQKAIAKIRTSVGFPVRFKILFI